MIHGQSLPGGATRVVDRHSSFYPIPIDDSGAYMLIDAGMDKRAFNLKRFMASRDERISAVKFVFLTHAHSDHVGALHEMPDGVVVFSSKADSEVLNGSMRSEGPLQGMIDRFPHHRAAAVPGAKPEILTDNQVLNIGKLTIRAIEMPGHTRGSLGYIVSHGSNEPSTFYSGDALAFSRRGDVLNAPRIFSGDIDASRQSIIDAPKRIADLGIEIGAVVPAHSGHGDFQALQSFR